VGIAAIWIANVLRITALIVIGTELSPDIAVGGFHSQAGWITFTLVALGLIAISHRLGLYAAPVARTTSPSPSKDEISAAALLTPLLVLLSTSILAAALSSGLDKLYPLGVLTTAAAIWYFRAAYRCVTWSRSWQPFAIGAAVFVAWLALEPPDTQGADALRAQLAQWPAWLAVAWIAFRVIGSTITVPIAEELAFRGYLLRKLVHRDFEKVGPRHFTWFSFCVSSVLFGLLHERWLVGTLAGACFALALYHRGRIGDAIVAHMTSNALIAGMVLVGGRWSLWA
jgi:exosortase E/protease (VPEID-CTERM system)